MAQNENIVDLFRYCARKDRILSQALQGDFSGFTLETQPEPEQVMDTTAEEPQPKLMEVESQLKSEWLCNKKLWVSDFELTFNGLLGDGSSIVSEFVDWESSGATYLFNELRDVLCGEANMCFNPERLFLFGLAYTGRDSKKIWTTRSIKLEGIEFQRHPQDLETLLNFDTKAEVFYFQKSLNIDAINNETLCIDRKSFLGKCNY